MDERAARFNLDQAQKWLDSLIDGARNGDEPTHADLTEARESVARYSRLVMDLGPSIHARPSVTVVAVPPPDEIHRQAAMALRNGFELFSLRAFAVVTGGHRPYVVGHQGCTCVVARCGEWCQHRSLFAVRFGQVEPPKRPPAPIIPFTPRKSHQERYPRPLRTPKPPIPFRPRTAA